MQLITELNVTHIAVQTQTLHYTSDKNPHLVFFSVWSFEVTSFDESAFLSFSFQEETTDVQDIDLSRFVPQEVDDAGITVAATDRFSSRNQMKATKENHGKKPYLLELKAPCLSSYFLCVCLTSDVCLILLSEEQPNGACGGAEANGLSGAEGGEDDDGGGEDDGEEVPVDENLFTGEDLDELDEELNTLGLEDWGVGMN